MANTLHAREDGRGGFECIIDGMRYETRKARFIAEHDNGYDPNSDLYLHEMLYKKRSDEYFLVTCGGKRALVSGLKIVPLSYADARQWASKRMDESGFIAEFSMKPHTWTGEEIAFVKKQLGHASYEHLARAVSIRFRWACRAEQVKMLAYRLKM